MTSLSSCSHIRQYEIHYQIYFIVNLIAGCLHVSMTVAGNLTTSPSATELTEDHHPDRDDERARIEAAGGYVAVWGVPRVNGVLAMSRSIGDF